MSFTRQLVLQWSFSIGLIYLAGFWFAFLSKHLFLTVRYHPAVIIAVGLIGVPIHELSHLIVGIIFNHRVESIRLFHFSQSEGASGFVKLKHRPSSFYQVIGNFFIGTAPIVVGLFFIVFLTTIFIPDYYTIVLRTIQLDPWINLSDTLNLSNVPINIYTLIYIYLCFSILCFMALSRSDIIISLRGLLIILPLWVLTMGIVYIINPDYMLFITDYILFNAQITFVVLSILSILFILIILVLKTIKSILTPTINKKT